MSNLRGGDTIGGYPIPGMLGTNGKIAKFNGSLITDSLISDDGSTITVAGASRIFSLTPNDTDGVLRVENTSTSTGSATNSQIMARSKYGSAQFMKWDAFGLRIGMRITANGDSGDIHFTTGNDSIKMKLQNTGALGIGGTTSSNNDATIHVREALGGFNRLTQMAPNTASTDALNLIASTDGSSTPRWWSWGVNSSLNAFAIAPTTNLSAPVFSVATNGVVTVGGAISLSPTTITGYAGQLNSTGTIKFSNGGSAQRIYVDSIGVSGSWADNDANVFAGGIYTYAGMKSKGDITMNVPTSGGNIGIKFNSNVNLTSDFGEIRYYDDNNTYSYWGETAENSALVISVGNDPRNNNSDVIVLKAPAAVIIDSEGFRLPVLSGTDPAAPITGMIWVRSDL